MQEMVRHLVPEKDDLLMTRVQIGNVKILLIFKVIVTEVGMEEEEEVPVNQKEHGSEVALTPLAVLPECPPGEVTVLGGVGMITLAEDKMMTLGKETLKQG